MTTTKITYGKILTVIESNDGLNKVYTSKILGLDKIIAGLECFSIRISLTKVNKTLKLIESLGFLVDIDYSYGFDFECKIYCNFKY
jgi:hypothetical protein